MASLPFSQMSYNVRVNSNREHPPRANPGHLFHDESWGPGIWQLIVSPPGIYKQQQTCFVTSCRRFLRRSESGVSSSQALSFWSMWRPFIDHKRPIKVIETFALSFFSRSDSFRDLFYAFLLSWNSCVYKNMATNNFVYWSDGLEGRAFDHHRRNGGRGICQQKLPAGPGIWMIFSNVRGMPGGLPWGGGGCSRLELTRT